MGADAEPLAEQFAGRGFAAVRGAFSAAEAAAMADVVWDALGEHGFARDDPRTWRPGMFPGLHEIKAHPVFAPIGGAPLRAALDALIPGWRPPRQWGQFLVNFPEPGPWDVPRKIWHTDYEYHADPDRPPVGALVFVLLSDSAPRGGATPVVAGSPRVVAEFARGRAADELTPMKRARLALMESDPWLRGLVGDTEQRVARYLERAGDVRGAPVQVTELTGAAGDVFIAHPWLLHASAPNCGAVPRLSRVQRLHVH